MREGVNRRQNNPAFVEAADPYTMLACGIIEQAVLDWKSLCDRNLGKRVRVPATVNFGELKTFFRSEWCDVLVQDSSYSPIRMLKRLESENGYADTSEHENHWEAVRKDFVLRGASIPQLSIRYNISEWKIRHHSREAKWAEQRRELMLNMSNKCTKCKRTSCLGYRCMVYADLRKRKEVDNDETGRADA